FSLICCPDIEHSLVQLTVVYASQREETVAEIHLAGRGIPDAWCQHRRSAPRLGSPEEHHQICVQDLLRLPSAEAQGISQPNLAGQTISTKRVRNLVIHKNEGCLLVRAVHFEAMIRLMVGREAANFENSEFDLKGTTQRFEFVTLFGLRRGDKDGASAPLS